MKSLWPFVAMLSLVACAQRSHAPHPPPHSDVSSFVRVAAATVDSLGAAIVAQGTVSFDEEHIAAIFPPVQGRVIRLLLPPATTCSPGLRSPVCTPPRWPARAQG